jgi:FSR family fosmidomycin resistance protein-like MFS transporter
MDARTTGIAPAAGALDPTVLAILIAISVSHFLNDTIQSLLMGIYPMLRDSFALDYGQIGLISFVFLVTASLLQPVVGIFTDKRPQPFSLAAGMGCSFAGLVLLAYAPSYGFVLLAAFLIGLGSAVFHPESSRIARLASGGRHGFAQSVFQVGGNAGNAVGPLLAAAIVVPYGQSSIAWFSGVAMVALVVLWRVGAWYRRIHFTPARRAAAPRPALAANVSRARVTVALAVLGALTFSKFFYLESFRSYYTFYLIDKYGLAIQTAQVLLFVQLFAIAAGTLIGGPIGDRIGRKIVIWVSILGVLPLTLILPHVGLVWTVILTVPIGVGIASAFPAIVVFAQELVPGKTGTVSGLFYGLAFGMGGLGAAALGELADYTSIEFVYGASAFLPAIGLLTVFLPDIEGQRR